MVTFKKISLVVAACAVGSAGFAAEQEKAPGKKKPGIHALLRNQQMTGKKIDRAKAMLTELEKMETIHEGGSVNQEKLMRQHDLLRYALLIAYDEKLVEELYQRSVPGMIKHTIENITDADIASLKKNNKSVWFVRYCKAIDYSNSLLSWAKSDEFKKEIERVDQLDNDFIAAASRGEWDLVQTLVAQGAEINKRGPVGSDYSALAFAMRDHNEAMVAFLLEHGAFPGVYGYRGVILAAACQGTYANVRIIKMLLKAGAPVNAQEYDVFNRPLGVTALHSVCYTDNIDIVECLLEHGADVLRRDYLGQTPLDIARKRGNQEIIALLEAKAAEQMQKQFEQMKI